MNAAEVKDATEEANRRCGKAMRCGEPCPYCGNDSVAYNGMLNLVCSVCGATQGGAFT